MKDTIKQVIDRDNEQEMQQLGELLYSCLEELSKYNRSKYDEMIDELYVCANGKHLSERMAREWVRGLPTGEHWDKDATDNVNAGRFHEWDWYAILNDVYSKYSDLELDTQTYVGIAAKFISDCTACEGKVYEYYKHILKK